MSRLVSAPDVAWVEVDDTVYVAVLPDPPIMVLSGAAALIWVTALQVDNDSLTEEVARRAGITIAAARTPVAEFIEDVVARGLIVRH